MSAAAAGTTAYGETGAGGKFRRKTLRKSQATPYDRPPIATRNTSCSGGGGNGWLSKIIDPASKLINASAHRLFGFAFRKRLLPPQQQQQMPPQQQQMPTPPQQEQMPPPSGMQDSSELNRITDSVPRSEIQFKVGGQTGTDHHTREHVSLDNNGRNQGMSELEKILAQKTFTESEINRLIALLNSRTVEDNGKIESEERPKTIFENGNSSEFKSPIVPDNGYNSERYSGATSSLFSNAKVMDDKIATPAELAKAYMGSRPSKVSSSMLGSRSQAMKDLPVINSVVIPSQSPFMSSAKKSMSLVSAPENGYMTPRLRGRSAVYSMARTPYCRTQKGSDMRCVNSYNFESPQLALEANKISSTRQTALKRRSNVLDDDVGSAGPIRRIRQRPSLLSSKILNEPAVDSPPINRPGVLSNCGSKNAQSKTPDENFKSVPPRSSVVAQKILQQLEKLSPPPKEKSSEHKSVVSPGKSAFTLAQDMLSGQALRSLEKAESSKIIESYQDKSKVEDSAKRVATDEEFTVLRGREQLEKNEPQKPASASKSDSKSALNSCDHPRAKNEQAFQVSAHEDCLHDSNGCSNGSSFILPKDKVGVVVSLKVNNSQTKSDLNVTFPNGCIKFGKEGKVSCSSGSLTMPIQLTAMDNASFPLFSKVSSDEQTTMAPEFGHGAKVADKFSPSTFASSSPTTNNFQVLHTSSLSESRTSNSSRLSDTFKIKPGDSMSTQGAEDARPSTVSNGISTTSTFFSSNAFANNGFASSSFPVQPPSATSQLSGEGTHNINFLSTTPSAASVPNAATGNSSSGVSLFSTSTTPQVSSKLNGPPTDIPTVNNTTSNHFGSGGTSPAKENGLNIFSRFGSSNSSPKVENQGIGTVSYADRNQSKTIATAAASSPQNTLFKFGVSGFSSAPAFSLSGTTNSAAANSTTSLPAPMFGKNPLPSKEAEPLGSNGGSSNSLFGSNWNSNSSPLFGSTTSSLAAPPPSVFQFGSSASSSAPISSSSTPGSLFGSSSAKLSFTSAAHSGSPSLFPALQPVTGSTPPAFTFGSPVSPTNITNNNPTTMEDTMAEDTLHTSAPTTSVFGQPQSSLNSVFTFGSTSPSVTGDSGVFQFGGQANHASSLNQTPFQASGSFNAGGGFSLGTTGDSSSLNAGGGFSLGKGDDKSARRIVKVKRKPKQR